MTPNPTLPESDTRPDAEAGFGALHTPRGNLPLKAVEVRTRIDGLIARTLVRQTFINAFPNRWKRLTFPIARSGAAVRLKVADRVVERTQERSSA